VEPLDNFPDVSGEIRNHLEQSRLVPEPVPRKVTFDDVPIFIKPELQVDDYNIVQDIKDQKANVTIGQLLHDNVNY